MTNVMPTAMTAQIETFWVMFVRLPAVRNWVGDSTPNTATMTTSTPRIQTDCIDLTRSSEAVVAGPPSRWSTAGWWWWSCRVLLP